MSSALPGRAQRSRPVTVAPVWLRVAGIGLALAAIALCAKTLIDQWPDVRSSIAHANLGWIAVAFVCSTAAMTFLGILWWRCLHVFGYASRRRDAVAWYFGGELGKYLPGGIWPVLGRGELARRHGISRAGAYATTLVSYAVMCIAAAVVCGLLAPLAGHRLGWTWATLALVPLGLAAAHPAVLGRALALGRRLSRGRLSLEPPPWSTMLGLIAWAVPTWILVGTASVAVTEALGYHQHVTRVAFAAVAAWVLGFLVVPVPAGAGLRELVFIGVSGLPGGAATAVAAIARLLLIIVDALGGLVGLVHTRRVAAKAGECTHG